MKTPFDRLTCFLDIESTGTDISTARIVELALITVHPESGQITETWCERFHPGMPIPPEATAVHGISDEDVRNRPTFDRLANRVHSILSGCDLAGYNLRNFDVPLLWEELYRAGIQWNLDGVRIFDAEAIFKKKESRRLEDAVRKYCGREHEGAHGAYADAKAVIDVLGGQLAAYPDLAAMGADELAAFCRMDDLPRIDFAGKLLRDNDGDAIFGFGKYKGSKVRDQLSYADWMLYKASFPENTRQALLAELNRLEAVDDEPLYAEREM